MEQLLIKSQALVKTVQTTFQRNQIHEINWENRLIGLKGPRGVGKTTLFLQRLKTMNLSPGEAAYFSLDDLYFANKSLVEVAESFYQAGGRFLFLDEVHKYQNWSLHLKNLYDFYPDLHIAFTGSSIINISKLEHDLSRRALMYEMQGLSFREYLQLTLDIKLPTIDLETLTNNSYDFQNSVIEKIQPLKHFSSYLESGYYPFFMEDKMGYPQRLNQLIRTIVEYDMAEIKEFDIRNAKKMLQLLSVVAAQVPFKPNISSLSQKTHIHRNSLNAYFLHLEKAKLIKLLYPKGISVALLQKPEKIYLDNTNLAYALSDGAPNSGNIRETFFVNQISNRHQVNDAKNGDFLVDNQFTFEVGGKDKTKLQIQGVENAFVVVDDVEQTISKDRIPLWAFGFLY